MDNINKIYQGYLSNPERDKDLSFLITNIASELNNIFSKLAWLEDMLLKKADTETIEERLDLIDSIGKDIMFDLAILRGHQPDYATIKKQALH